MLYSNSVPQQSGDHLRLELYRTTYLREYPSGRSPNWGGLL